MTAPLTQEEFDRMEALLVALAPHCDADEKTALIEIHAKLWACFERQIAKRRSLERLQALAAKSTEA